MSVPIFSGRVSEM